MDADEVALTAIDAGAEDVDTDGDETIEIYTAPGELESVRKALEAAGVPVESAESTMIAKQTVELDSSKARQALRLVELLEDLDDVPAGDRQLRHPRGRLRRGRRVMVLGIDPGTAALGYGIVERTRWPAARGRPRLPDHEPGPAAAASGCSRSTRWSTSCSRSTSRTSWASSGCSSRATSRRRWRSGQARGVVLLAAAQHGTPVREATPNEVKSAIAGYGAADKEQVQRMVQLVLGHERAADARTTPPTRWRSRSGSRTRIAAARARPRPAVAGSGGDRPDHPRRDAATSGPSARRWPPSERQRRTEAQRLVADRPP